MPWTRKVHTQNPSREAVEPPGGESAQQSAELAQELDAIETEQRQERDRQREEELARLRERARFD